MKTGASKETLFSNLKDGDVFLDDEGTPYMVVSVGWHLEAEVDLPEGVAANLLTGILEKFDYWNAKVKHLPGASIDLGDAK